MIRQILLLIMRGTVILLYLACMTATVLWLDLRMFANQPQAPGADPVTVWVKPGQSLKSISQTLQGHGLIATPWKFQLMAQIQRRGHLLKAGEFSLSGNMAPAEILDVLVRGKVTLYRVTFPEGLNAVEVARVLEEGGFLNAAEFITLAMEPEVAQSYGIEAATLEGYLFPDTYMLPRTVTPRRMIRMMVHRFYDRVGPEIETQAVALGFNLHEAIILASLIEKEAAVDTERRVIASVFHNRLKRNMRLDSDPTAVYGLEDFEGKILRRHLQTDSPYNTYRIRGLPVGPIANPGLHSIKAAVDPLDTDYLFFVARGDLTHEFSTSLEEHNRAVQKYIFNR